MINADGFAERAWGMGVRTEEDLADFVEKCLPIEIVHCKDCDYYYPMGNDWCGWCSHIARGWADAMLPTDFCSRGVKKVEAEPVKHGYNTGEGVRWFRCSECGWGFNDIYMTDESDIDTFPQYCPHCGVKIDEVDNAKTD